MHKLLPPLTPAGSAGRAWCCAGSSGWPAGCRRPCTPGSGSCGRCCGRFAHPASSFRPRRTCCGASAELRRWTFASPNLRHPGWTVGGAAPGACPRWSCCLLNCKKRVEGRNWTELVRYFCQTGCGPKRDIKVLVHRTTTFQMRYQYTVRDDESKCAVRSLTGAACYAYCAIITFG